jgi:hypothetical protein
MVCTADPFKMERYSMLRPDASPPLFACANKLRGLSMTGSGANYVE